MCGTGGGSFSGRAGGRESQGVVPGDITKRPPWEYIFNAYPKTKDEDKKDLSDYHNSLSGNDTASRRSALRMSLAFARDPIMKGLFNDGKLKIVDVNYLKNYLMNECRWGEPDQTTYIHWGHQQTHIYNVSAFKNELPTLKYGFPRVVQDGWRVIAFDALAGTFNKYFETGIGDSNVFGHRKGVVMIARPVPVSDNIRARSDYNLQLEPVLAGLWSGQALLGGYSVKEWLQAGERGY